LLHLLLPPSPLILTPIPRSNWLNAPIAARTTTPITRPTRLTPCALRRKCKEEAGLAYPHGTLAQVEKEQFPRGQVQRRLAKDSRRLSWRRANTNGRRERGRDERGEEFWPYLHTRHRPQHGHIPVRGAGGRRLQDAKRRGRDRSGQSG
ncbi:hypothetical protein PMAYCL1PPCAC_11397, partial [Pristionchus mayeri]